LELEWWKSTPLPYEDSLLSDKLHWAEKFLSQQDREVVELIRQVRDAAAAYRDTHNMNEQERL